MSAGLKILCHIVYWGLGTPVVLFMGAFIFFMVHGLKCKIVESLPGWSSALISISCFVGCVFGLLLLAFIWTAAGMHAGYIKSEEE